MYNDDNKKNDVDDELLAKYKVNVWNMNEYTASLSIRIEKAFYSEIDRNTNIKEKDCYFGYFKPFYDDKQKQHIDWKWYKNDIAEYVNCSINI